MRPLSLDELRWAMLIDDDCPYRSLYECQAAGDYPFDHDGMKRRVQTLSCGLAETTSHEDVVQFIHQSVKDFFVEKGLSILTKPAKADLVAVTAHYQLSRTCIRYLAMEEVGGFSEEETMPQFPLLQYATTSWVAHMKQSDARSVPQEGLLEYFARASNFFMKRWVGIYRISNEYSNDCPVEGTSLVHVMSRYGIAGVLGAFLKRADQVGVNINAQDSFGQTPLWWAVENGHEAIVQLLLDSGADTEVSDQLGMTPLLQAAKEGCKTIVQLLLNIGADTNATDNNRRTPLWWAVAYKHEAIVQLLLDSGAATNVPDQDCGWTPLSMATELKREAILQLLQVYGCIAQH